MYSRSVLKGFVTLTLLLASVVLGFGPYNADAVSLTLYGRADLGWGFTQDSLTIPGPNITVGPGERVDLSLFGLDGLPHNFWVDYNNNSFADADEPVSAFFTSTLQYSFDATQTQGTYRYYCQSHAPTMRGFFQVNPSTTLSVTPSEVSALVGQRFTVAVDVADVSDLYAYNVTVRYDTAVLDALSARLNGTIFENRGIPFAPRNLTVSDSLGEVHAEVWIQGTYPGANGNGTLLFIDFIPRVGGTSAIQMVSGRTDLRDAQFRQIPFRTFDGTVQTTLPFGTYYSRSSTLPQWMGGGSPQPWRGDDFSFNYTLPFSFPFFEDNYTQIFVSTNGLVTFMGPDNEYRNSQEALIDKRAIAPLWDDWNVEGIYYIFVDRPDPDHLLIRWFVAPFESPFSPVNFEMLLSSDGEIRFDYSSNSGPISATVGISNGAGYAIVEAVRNSNFTDTLQFQRRTGIPPIPSFTIAPDQASVGQPLLFNGSASHDPDGNVTDYLWSLGDGSNARAAIVSHTYSAEGTYEVSLTVLDDQGIGYSLVKTIVILPGIPLADFAMAPLNPVAGETVIFDASNSTDPDGGPIVGFAWSFGDGATGSGMVETHTYSSSGVFDVSLTVTDDEGLTGVRSRTLQVSLADVRLADAWPAMRSLRLRTSSSMTLYAEAINIGNLETNLYVSFTVTGARSGDSVTLLVQVATLGARERVILNAVFVPPNVNSRYTVSITLYFSPREFVPGSGQWFSGGTASFMFHVIPART